MTRSFFLLPLMLAVMTTRSFAADIMIHDAYAYAPLKGMSNGVAYMQLHNGADEDVVITGVTSDVTPDTELHDHVDADGMMRMQRIESITIPAGEMVELKSGGKHVMLINVQEPMPVGEEITIIFSLKDGSTVKTSVPVKDRVKKQSMPDAHEGHDAHAHH